MNEKDKKGKYSHLNEGALAESNLSKKNKIEEAEITKTETEMVSVSSKKERDESLLSQKEELVEIPIQQGTSNVLVKSFMPPTTNRKGNMYMFLFDQNGCPRICIGPHCEQKKKLT